MNNKLFLFSIPGEICSGVKKARNLYLVTDHEIADYYLKCDKKL
jgi:hypothetical protein